MGDQYGDFFSPSPPRDAVDITALPAGQFESFTIQQPWVDQHRMDLFHTITQSIDQVLTCHWLTDFKAFKMSGNDKLMNTERGGEQTQYVLGLK